MKERFWTLECYASGDAEGDSARRQCHTLTTEHLLDAIELLLTEYDGREDIQLFLRSHPDGTRMYVIDGPQGRRATFAALPEPHSQT